MILDKKYLFFKPFQNLALLAVDDIRRTVENSTKPKLKLTNCRTKYNWNRKRSTPKCIRQLFQLLRIVKRGRGHNWKYERRTPKLVSATFRDRCRTNLSASFQNWIQSGILSVFGRHSHPPPRGVGLHAWCAETNFPAGINQAQQAAASAQQHCCFASSLAWEIPAVTAMCQGAFGRATHPLALH